MLKSIAVMSTVIVSTSLMANEDETCKGVVDKDMGAAADACIFAEPENPPPRPLRQPAQGSLKLSENCEYRSERHGEPIDLDSFCGKGMVCAKRAGGPFHTKGRVWFGHKHKAAGDREDFGCKGYHCCVCGEVPYSKKELTAKKDLKKGAYCYYKDPEYEGPADPKRMDSFCGEGMVCARSGQKDIFGSIIKHKASGDREDFGCKGYHCCVEGKVPIDTKFINSFKDMEEKAACLHREDEIRSRYLMDSYCGDGLVCAKKGSTDDNGWRRYYGCEDRYCCSKVKKIPEGEECWQPGSMAQKIGKLWHSIRKKEGLTTDEKKKLRGMDDDCEPGLVCAKKGYQDASGIERTFGCEDKHCCSKDPEGGKSKD